MQSSSSSSSSYHHQKKNDYRSRNFVQLEKEHDKVGSTSSRAIGSVTNDDVVKRFDEMTMSSSSLSKVQGLTNKKRKEKNKIVSRNSQNIGIVRRMMQRMVIRRLQQQHPETKQQQQQQSAVTMDGNKIMLNRSNSEETLRTTNCKSLNRDAILQSIKEVQQEQRRQDDLFTSTIRDLVMLSEMEGQDSVQKVALLQQMEYLQKENDKTQNELNKIIREMEQQIGEITTTTPTPNDDPFVSSSSPNVTINNGYIWKEENDNGYYNTNTIVFVTSTKRNNVQSMLYPSDEEKSESSTTEVVIIENEKCIETSCNNTTDKVISNEVSDRVATVDDTLNGNEKVDVDCIVTDRIEESQSFDNDPYSSAVEDSPHPNTTVENKTLTANEDDSRENDTLNGTLSSTATATTTTTHENSPSVLPDPIADTVLAELKEQTIHASSLTHHLATLEQQQKDVTQILEDNIRMVNTLKGEMLESETIVIHASHDAEQVQNLEMLRKEISIITLENVVLKNKLEDLTRDLQLSEKEVGMLHGQIDELKMIIEKIKSQNQYLLNELDEFNKRKVSDAVEYKAEVLSLISELERARKDYHTIQNDNMTLSNTIMDCDEKIDRLVAVAVDANDIIIPNLEEEISLLREVVDAAHIEKEETEQKYQELLRFVAELDTQNTQQIENLMEKLCIQEKDSKIDPLVALERKNISLMEELSVLREQEDDQMVLVAEELHKKEVEIYMLIDERQRLLLSVNELTNEIKRIRTDDTNSNKENIPN